QDKAVVLIDDTVAVAVHVANVAGPHRAGRHKRRLGASVYFLHGLVEAGCAVAEVRVDGPALADDVGSIAAPDGFHAFGVNHRIA
nr:hypothetical protein [Tanacetum cinerariifolium]